MQEYYQNWIEGPHITLQENGTFAMHYLSASGERVYELPAPVMQKVQWLKGQEHDQHQTYPIAQQLTAPVTEQDNIEKILLLGDQHGHYHKLLRFLKANNVIDPQDNWSWGAGHLVFCGDLLDRGLEVVPLLWLAIKLEQQAAAAGGAVHVLLGNHELMVLQGDYRYVHPQLQELYHTFNIAYNTFFGTSWYLGRWLRSRNAVIRLNKLLISHAGISPMIAASKLPLEEINRLIRTAIAKGATDGVSSALVSTNGPLWYRGYVRQSAATDHAVNEQQLSEILQFYLANAMVVAHTPVQQISSLLGGQVWAIDLDIESEEVAVAGLLVEETKYSILTSEGSRLPTN